MTKSEVINRCIHLKKGKRGINSFLNSQGYSKAESAAIEAEVKKKLVKNKECKRPAEDSAEEWAGILKFTDKYSYNKEDDKYVIYLKAASSNVVLTGDVVRGIKENYSNWCGEEHSINDICLNYKIPRNYMIEILKVLGITHDSEPCTDEEIAEKGVDVLADDILQKKKFQLHQEFQKRSWKQTEEAAVKWFKMQEGVYNPFTSFLASWNPPKHTPIKYTGPVQKKNNNKALLVGLSDVHYGAKTTSNESYRAKSYSTEEATKCIEKYAEDIKQIVQERNYGFSECVLASLGDILHTTGSGYTTKGTMLVHDCIKEEQFNFAFDSIVKFIDNLLSLFPKVKVKSVKGNHNDVGDYILFKALGAYYRTDKRICFDNFQTDHGLFKINNCLFVISHGYSAEYKGRLPASGKARESYVANLFLSKPEALIGVSQKVLITADQHHLEMREYAEFEHYMLSTTVRGDKHSEAMGLNNIARQSCFVIDETGVREIVYCYGKR